MTKLISSAVVALTLLCFTSCSNETEEFTFTQSGSITFSSGPEKDVLADREFKALEEAEFSVASTEPRLIGFSVDLTKAERDELIQTAKQSGVFEDNYSGSVDQLPRGNGIGASEGAYIEMAPVDGVIQFKFKNFLKRSHKFEIYTTETSTDM